MARLCRTCLDAVDSGPNEPAGSRLQRIEKPMSTWSIWRSAIAGTRARCILALLAAGLVGCTGKVEPTRAPIDLAVECGISLGLTEEDGIKEDWGGNLQSWSGSREGNRLTFTRRGMCGDECNFTEEIVLILLAGDCPSLLSARVTETDAGSAAGAIEHTRWANEGALQIQDWDPDNGPTSGRLTAEFELTFFVDLVGK